MSIINKNGFIKSDNIKVFPCAYRGSYSKTENDIEYIKFFNPEACTTSEYNFVNSFHKLSNKKESYVVDWTPSTSTQAHNGILKFVLNGYYFEIINCDITDFFESNNKPKSLYIKVSENDNEGEVPASILYSFNTSEESSLSSTNVENSLCLDYKDGEEYVFSGLKVTSDIGDETYTGKLSPFSCRYNEVDTTSFTAATDYLGKYILVSSVYTFVDADNIKTMGITSNENGKYLTKCYTPEFFLSPSDLAITSLLDCGIGKYSLKVLANIKNSVDNSTNASGDYSVALGKKTTASGFASTSLGNETEASGNYTLSGGKESKAKANNSIAFGDHTETDDSAAGSVALGSYTKTTAENQVVIGKYNKDDRDQAFIIANGDTARGIGANKFTVGYEGNVKALGTLDIVGATVLQSTLNVKGSIDVNALDSNDTPSNNLTLGAYTTETYEELIPEKDENGNIVTDEDGNTVYETEKDEDGNIALDSEGAIIYKKETKTRVLPASGTISVYGQNPTSVSDKVFSVSNTGKTYIDDETNATTSDGALKVAGGVRIAKKLNVGETLDVAGDVILGGNSSTNIVNIKKEPDDNDVNVRITGTTRIDGTTNIWGALGVHSEAESTTKNHGAIVVTGGVGVGKNLNVGGDTNLNNKLIVTTTPTGTNTNVKVDGTLNVTNETTIATNATINSTKTTLSKPVEITDTTTNALKISGGAVIGGNINIGGGVDITSNISAGGSLMLTGGSETHSITAGHKTSDTDKSAGSILLYTTAGNEGFKVSNTGEANIYSKLEVGTSANSKVTINSGAITTTGAIRASGELTSTDITASGTFTANSTTATHTIGSVSITGGAISGGTSISTGSATLTGALTVGGALTANNDSTNHQIGSVIINGGTVTGVSNLTASGKVRALVFNALSDARKKTNIKDYQCAKSILDLPIKSFEYANDESHTSYIGCIAQDLQEICPEIVSEDTEGYLSIQESKLIYLLLQEVKELKQKVEILERR